MYYKDLQDLFPDLGSQLSQQSNGDLFKQSWACNPVLGTRDRVEKTLNFSFSMGWISGSGIRWSFWSRSWPTHRPIWRTRSGYQWSGVEHHRSPVDFFSSQSLSYAFYVRRNIWVWLKLRFHCRLRDRASVFCEATLVSHGVSNYECGSWITCYESSVPGSH